MEILCRGTLPSERTYTATCRNCNCRFRFKKGEAKYEEDSRNGAYLEIQCPEPHCKTSCTIGAHLYDR